MMPTREKELAGEVLLGATAHQAGPSGVLHATAHGSPLPRAQLQIPVVAVLGRSTF